ncbi:putative disease resistance RPP13-like protein 1 [Glycine soja]
MALAMVGEALISASVEILTKRIASREFRDFFSSRKLNISVLDELMKLLALNAVLNDAEEKQITDLAVKEWLEELKDAVLDAEDLLDEINTDALRCEVEDETKTSTTKIFLACKVLLGVYYRTVTDSLVESFVVAREDDKEKLLSMLLSDDDAMSNDIAVITVLGMGGLGKTTLVQSLYNDSEVQKHFDLTAWAWVSDDFNILKVTKKIVESLTSKDCHILKVIVTSRQQKVAQVTHTCPTYELQHLSDENCWQILARHAFGHEGYDKYPSLEKMGRKIARKCNGLPLAAKTLGGLLRSNVDAAEWNRTLNSNLWAHDDVLPALRISFLQHNKEKAIESVGDDCFNELSSRSLIQKESAIAEENFQMHDLIYDLARLVSRRSSCYFEGGEISRTVRHLSFLREMFDVSEKFEALYELKCLRTFVPQSEYPTFLPRMVYPFEHCYLTKMVSHGSLNSSLFLTYIDVSEITSGDKCLNIAILQLWTMYMNEWSNGLGYRSVYGFLEPQSIHNAKDRRGHCEEYIEKWLKESQRQLYIGAYLNDSSNTGDIISSKDEDVTVATTGVHQANKEYFNFCTYHGWFPKLRCLRILSLSKYKNITELPDSIGNLLHLWYLDLSYTSIESLSYETFMLYNLQTLILSNCEFLIQLPQPIGNLVNLRHLDISYTNFPEMATQICRLQDLRTLTVFIVGKQDGLSIRDLRKFPYLLGKLSILNLQNVVNPVDAFRANLKNKEQIEELMLEWGSNPQDPQIEKDSLMLVSDCNNCLLLPPFGQLPSLKELVIKRMKMVKTVGYEFYGSNAGSQLFHLFPSLESLEFEDMPEWQEWLPFESEGRNFPFPCLKRLYLHKCPQLRGTLPNYLPSLTNVSFSECNQLVPNLSDVHWNISIEKVRIFIPQYMAQIHITSKAKNMEKLSFLDILFICLFPCPSRALYPFYSKLGSNYYSRWRSSFQISCFIVTDCEKLRSLPDQIDLPALEHLDLSGLPKLDCPQGVFLPVYDHFTLMFEYYQLCLDKIKGLRNDEDLINTLLKEHGLKLLEGKGLQNLTSLQMLHMYNCPSFESSPEDQLPSSLCPLLEARYRGQNGKYWSKIAYIPAIQINEKPLCIYKGKAAYNIPPLYLRIAKSLWAMEYEVFYMFS